MKKQVLKKKIETVVLIILLAYLFFTVCTSIIENYELFKKNSAAHLYLAFFFIFLYPTYLGLKWGFEKISTKRKMIIPIWISLIILLAITYYYYKEPIVIITILGAGLIFNIICLKLRETPKPNTPPILNNADIEVKLRELNNCLLFSEGVISKYISNQSFKNGEYINWVFYAQKKSEKTIPSILHACIFSLLIIDPQVLEGLRTNKEIASYIKDRVQFKGKYIDFDDSIISRARKKIKNDNLSLEIFIYYIKKETE